jgi:hypothetical protein
MALAIQPPNKIDNLPLSSPRAEVINEAKNFHLFQSPKPVPFPLSSASEYNLGQTHCQGNMPSVRKAKAIEKILQAITSPSDIKDERIGATR